MALFDLIEIVRKVLQLRRRGDLQRKAELGIELPEGATQHGLNLSA